MELPPSIQELWLAYEEAERSHVRSEIPPTMEALMDGLDGLGESRRDEFALRLAHRSLDRDEPPRIRMPLFRRLLFPALRRGIARGEGDCARWLAQLEGQRSQTPELMEALPPDLRTTLELLRFALDRNGQDERASRMIIELFQGWIEFSIHEVPWAVLGPDSSAASVEDCDENLADLQEFERYLAAAGRVEEFGDLCREARFHNLQFRRYLTERRDGSDSYEEFLERQ